MDKEKLIHQLFVGKVSEVIGFEKTTKLLKEAHEAINVQSEQRVCDHEFTHKPLGGNVYCWKCCALQTK